MEYREIPEGSIEIQPGLWAELHTYTVGYNTRSRYNLYSAEGYCFYSLNVPENFDEDGNVRPANERVYSTFAAYPPTMTLKMVNADAVSLPVGENGEVIDEPEEATESER